jgi:hypothetical protein
MEKSEISIQKPFELKYEQVESEPAPIKKDRNITLNTLQSQQNTLGTSIPEGTLANITLPGSLNLITAVNSTMTPMSFYFWNERAQKQLRIDFNPQTQVTTINIVDSNDNVISTAPWLGAAPIPDLTILYVFIIGDYICVVVTSSGGTPSDVQILCTMKCPQVETLTQFSIPTQITGFVYASSPSELASLGGPSPLLFAGLYPLITPSPTQQYPGSTNCGISEPLVTNEGWIVIVSLIAVSVLFIILFGLSIGKVIP